MARISLVADQYDVATDLLRFLFRFRRLSSDRDPCKKTPCARCFVGHLEKVAGFIAKGEPVHFVIPAFPAKSRSAKKVLGTLPDLGEKIAIGFLQSVCDQLTYFHPPGGRITICSDGHVFSDVLGIPDEDVSEYRAELQQVIGRTGGKAIDLYSLEDGFGAIGYDRMRQLLVDRYGSTVEQIRQQVRTNPSMRSLFNGIHRFMVEDESALRQEVSRTQLRAECKHLAYQVIQRSNAWGELVAEAFPDALRLSIHPQPSHSEKIGFHLIRTADNWLTPWHGVVVDDGHRFTLTKRSEAEAMNATLVWRDDRPSHFVAPNLDPEELAA